jgi:hypothetical protein
VKVNVRVVVGVMKGAIAMEAQKAKASWVILDRQAIMLLLPFFLSDLNPRMHRNRKCPLPN